MIKHWKYYLGAGILIAGVIAGGLDLEKTTEFKTDGIAEDLKIKAEKPSDIIDYTIKDSIAEYVYLDKEAGTSAIVKDGKTIHEDMSKRTANTHVYDLGNGKTEYQIFSGQPYYKQDSKWRLIEIATTTKAEWDKQTTKSFSEKLLTYWFKTITAADYYSASGDGWVKNVVSGAGSWATAQGASSGSGYSSTSTSNYASLVKFESAESTATIYRSFFPVDTSAINDSETISSSTFALYITNAKDVDNDSYDYLALVQTSQASTSILSLDDFDTCGSSIDNPEEGSARKDITYINVNVYTYWDFNSTGRSWIDKAGFTKIGMREGHDMVDNQPNNDTYNYIINKWADTTGTSTDPYLSIITEAGSPPAASASTTMEVIIID